MSEEAMTLKQVAKRLHVSERTILRLLDRKEIKGYQVGRSWRFEPADVEEYIERKRNEAEKEAA